MQEILALLFYVKWLFIDLITVAVKIRTFGQINAGTYCTRLCRRKNTECSLILLPFVEGKRIG